MKYFFIPLIFWTCSAFSQGALTSGYHKQETQNIYQGHAGFLLWQSQVVRVGVTSLTGEFVSGAEVDNTSLLLGATKAFTNFYVDWDSEVSQKDIRKPYSQHSLKGYFASPWAELGVGYRYSDFAADDAHLGLVSARHYFNDHDYFGIFGYFDVKQSDLKSYSLAGKKKWDNNFEVYGNYAWGRAQEDIGLIQNFKAASMRLSYGFARINCGVEVTRSWGDIILDSIYGMTCSWKQ